MDHAAVSRQDVAAGLVSGLMARVRSRFAKPQTLLLGPDGVTSGVTSSVASGGQREASPSSRHESFADWCQAHVGAACSLVVGARLLHGFAFEPGLPLPDAATREAYARQQFTHYFGAIAQRWAVATWSVDGVGGASALHGVDLAALRAAADLHGVSVRRVEPFWAPLLRTLKRREPAWFMAERAALAWVEGSLLSWITLDAGRVTGLRALRLAEPTHAALHALLSELRAKEPGRRLVLGGFGLDAVAAPALADATLLGKLDAGAAHVELFDTAPSSGLTAVPAPDFLGPRIARSPLAWPLAVTGLVVLATAVCSLLASQQRLREANEHVASLERQGAQRAGANPVAATTVATSARSKRDDDANERELRAVQGQLDTPWGPLLSTIEQAGMGADSKNADSKSAASRIDWLNLDYTAARASLRLTGLAHDKATALQVVDRLGSMPGMSEVLMNRIEDGQPSLPGQRFEIGARVASDVLAQASSMAAASASGGSGAPSASGTGAVTVASAASAARAEVR